MKQAKAKQREYMNMLEQGINPSALSKLRKSSWQLSNLLEKLHWIGTLNIISIVRPLHKSTKTTPIQ
ncbi:hypothetical protein CRYPD_1358 [uncultured Candidatus Thioglobus sp.]|nr:hypothetical protein CRYPD_1358 [uncultured Candidatus Thioglobus sp.]